MAKKKIKSSAGFTHEYGDVNVNRPGSHIKIPKTAEEYKYRPDYAGSHRPGIRSRMLSDQGRKNFDDIDWSSSRGKQSNATDA